MAHVMDGDREVPTTEGWKIAHEWSIEMPHRKRDLLFSQRKDLADRIDAVVAGRDAEILILKAALERQREIDRLHDETMEIKDAVVGKLKAINERLKDLLREARGAMLRQGLYRHMGPHRLAEEIGRALGEQSA